MSVILALFATFFSSLGGIIESRLINRKFSHHVPAVQELVASTSINALLLGIIGLFLPQLVWFRPELLPILLLISIGVIDMGYNFFMLKAMEQKSISNVYPLIATSPIVTLFLSAIFLKVTNGFWLFLIIIVTVAGLYILECKPSPSRSWKQFFSFHKKTWAWESLAAAFSLGLSSVLMAYTLQSHFASELLILIIRMGIIALMSHLFFRTKFFPQQYPKNTWLFISIGLETIYIIGRLFSTYAIGMGDVTVVQTLMSTSPLFIMLFDSLFLKEKVTKRKIAGTSLVVAGILLAMVKVS